MLISQQKDAHPEYELLGHDFLCNAIALGRTIPEMVGIVVIDLVERLAVAKVRYLAAVMLGKPFRPFLGLDIRDGASVARQQGKMRKPVGGCRIGP